MNPGEIVIKGTEVLTSLMERNFSPLLIRIVTDIIKDYGGEIVQAYRVKKGLYDPHSTLPGQAVDLAWGYPDKTGYRLIHQINRQWQYNKTDHEQVASVRDRGGKTHIHIQVCNETRWRGI